MLTAEMRKLITDHTAGMVATINDDGTPSVSPKATFVVLDDRTLAFGNLRSPGTLANLLCRSAGLPSGAVSAAPFGQVFEPLKNPSYFARFFIDGGTVAWPNGADIAPETLHERVKASAAA